MRSPFGIEHSVAKKAPSAVRALLYLGKKPKTDYGMVRAATQIYGNPKFVEMRAGNAKQQEQFRRDFAELKHDFHDLVARRKPKKRRLRKV